MDNSIRDFIKDTKEEGLTDATIKKYVSDIKQFHKFIKIKIDKNFEQLEEDEIKKQLERYISHLEKERYKPSTINAKIVIINKYLKILGVECRHKYLKLQKKIYIENVLTEGEYRRIIESCNNKRDELIIQMLVNTGVRISELLSLTIQDINRKEIYVKGKGEKYREIIIPPQLKQKIKEYIKEYRQNTDNDKLFTGKRGALKRDAVNKILYKYAKKGHVNKTKAHPHSCRHLFAKRLAERGTSLDVIQSCLGHESIVTTSIYTKRSKEELERTLEDSFI